MNIQIRQEIEKDYDLVEALIQEAFLREEYSDGNEHILVHHLRKSEGFIPELSLVAQCDDQLVGHILFSPIDIIDGSTSNPSLALAPVSVLPEYQGRGIGGQLIKTGHEIAKNEGYHSVILVGHEHYYPRFGYVPCANFGISLPFEVPEPNSMAIELISGALTGIRGTVRYPKEFSELE